LWTAEYTAAGYCSPWRSTEGCGSWNIWWQWLLPSHTARIHSTQEQLWSCRTYEV